MALTNIDNIDEATLDRELAKAAASLDRHSERLRYQYVALLLPNKASDKEAEAFMEWLDGYFAAWRDEELRRLRAWLLRGGED